jgi:hypothetical protein
MQLSESEKEQQLSRQLLYSLVSRMSMGNTTSYGGLRDVWSALGYPADGKLNFDHFWLKYKRQDVAAAVIEKPVEGAWRQLPVVRGIDDNDTFQMAWESLEEELGIFRTLIRADIMSRIGEYAVMVFGFDDGADRLSDPVERAKSLLYLQPYLQKHAEIKSLVEDNTDPRFGLPDIYSVQINHTTSTNTNTMGTLVHHSRILHIADNLIESNIYGMPALERVYNRLENMELIVGGSAEMFWRGAFPGMAFSVKDGATLTDAGRVELEEEIQSYVHDLQRYMKLQGLDIQQLATQIADPATHADIQLKFISVATGIPKRILEGSERGELASSQDSESWNNKCDTRRRNHCENTILRPFIQRLGDIGVLDVPDEYEVEWPDLESQSDEAKSKVGKDRTEAIAKYADSPTAPLVVPPREFLMDILELPEEKVDRIMDALGGSELTAPEPDDDDEVGFAEDTP